MKRIRKPDPRDGWYQITVEDAPRFLAEQCANRPLRELRASRIAGAIKAGRWVANGEPIIFDDKGKMIDGQHRCRAVLIAGLPIETYCVFGVKRTVFPSLDQGINRNGADTLALQGAKNYAIVAAMVRHAILADELNASQTNYQLRTLITNADVNDYWRKHREEIEAAIAELYDILPSWPSALKGLIPPSALAYVYMRGRAINAPAALAFARGVITGESLVSGDPALALRRRQVKGTTVIALAMAIKAMNAALEHRKLLLVKWDPSRESYPRIGDKEDR